MELSPDSPPNHPKCLHRQTQYYVDATGRVLPCCWIVGTISDDEFRIKNGKPPKSIQRFQHYLDEFNLDKASLDELLSRESWKEYLSLMMPPMDAPKVCFNQCGDHVKRLNNPGAVIQGDLSLNEIDETYQTRLIHVEPTTRCVLECSRCSRTMFPKQFQQVDMPLTQFSSIAESTQVAAIMLCGTYGDPIYHPELHSMIEIANANHKPLQIITNGVRSPRWWERTVELMLQNPHPHITFSVDGLQDTNHIYRTNSNWDHVLSAMTQVGHEAANGNMVAVWKFIVFRHNEHQVDEARALAATLGLQFQTVHSTRYGIKY